MDFRNALIPNDNVNLYCSSLTRTENAYAVASTSTVSVEFPSTGGIEIYEFRLLTQPVNLLNIALSADAGTFTISKKGVYSVFCSMNVSAQDAGSQGQVSLLVDGTILSSNILFPSGVRLESCLTVMGSVVCNGVTPKEVSIQVRYVQGTTPANVGDFRYGQMLITKLSD